MAKAFTYVKDKNNAEEILKERELAIAAVKNRYGEEVRVLESYFEFYITPLSRRRQSPLPALRSPCR